MAKYIEFLKAAAQPKGGKTKRWFVYPKGQVWAEALGEVKWFGRWRCYGFFPAWRTVYEKTCLRDLAEFCESETSKHKQEPPHRYPGHG